MAVDYVLGLILGFVHGLLAAYVVTVLNKRKHKTRRERILDSLGDDLF